MTTTLILVVFCVLVALTALALIYSKWPGWIKGLLVLAVSAFYFVAQQASVDLSGWASAEKLPERFVLLAAVIEEPSKNQPGALFVWVNPIEQGSPSPEPRAYRLPYAKDLHSLLSEGMKKARQGVSQLGTAEPKVGRKGFNWLRAGADEQVIKIRDLPTPQLPEK